LQGGKAIRITPASGFGGEINKLDGLILGGGADINPGRYGADMLTSKSKNKKKVTGYRQWLHLLMSAVVFPALFIVRKLFSVKRSKSLNTAKGRDDMEFALLREALRKNIPILGICRGAQLLNVQFGGNLYQDISSFYTEVPQVHTIWPEKTVDVVSGSRLAGIMESLEVRVNALHYQAVDRLGRGLQVAATEDNGVIQAVEHPGYPFVIGVQWHPEYMPQLPYQRALFRELIKHAKMRMGGCAEGEGEQPLKKGLNKFQVSVFLLINVVKPGFDFICAKHQSLYKTAG
jgi:putative glutamine amidotransferase